MKTGPQIALAITAGYLLGRRRKLRLAAVLAGAVATGRLGALGGAALKRSASLAQANGVLGKVSPQLGDIANTVKGDLVKAGKAAAVAAVTSRMDSLSDSLRDRTEAIRGPGQGRVAPRERNESDQDYEEDDADFDDDLDELEDSAEEIRDADDEDYIEEPDDVDEDEDEDIEPADSYDSEVDDEYEDRGATASDRPRRSPVSRAER
jgi:cytochrome c556